MSLEINTDDFWKELDQRVLDARTERKLFIEEITKLREQVVAQAAVIEAIRNCLKEIRGLSYATTWEIINEALAIPTDSTQILDEVRRAERERQLAEIPLDDIKQALTKYSEMLVHVDCGPVYRKHLVEILDKAQAAIRAME